MEEVIFSRTSSNNSLEVARTTAIVGIYGVSFGYAAPRWRSERLRCWATFFESFSNHVTSSRERLDLDEQGEVEKPERHRERREEVRELESKIEIPSPRRRAHSDTSFGSFFIILSLLQSLHGRNAPKKLESRQLAATLYLSQIEHGKLMLGFHERLSASS